MAKIQIKSEKFTPFGGIFSDHGAIWLHIVFCNRLHPHNFTTHLMNHLSLHPTLRTCSSDTILRAIKELTQENISYTSDAGKNYDFNVLPSENAFPTFSPNWI